MVYLKIVSIPVNKNISAKNRIEKSPLVIMRNLEIILSNYSRAKNTKYKELWQKAKLAISNQKIFIIHSLNKYSHIRKILKNRGWVEKLDFRRLNYLLSELNVVSDDSILETLTLAKIVRSNPANFVWLDGDYRNIKLEPHQMCNTIRFKGNCFTTKSGLCELIKDEKWHCIPGISKVNAPRSYNAYNMEEVEEFKFDYKLTACTSLLKWFAATYDRDEALFERKGAIPFSTIHFALEGCKVYLAIKKHEDIDKVKIGKPIYSWDEFLLNCHKLIQKIDNLNFDTNDGIDIYVTYAKNILERIGEYNPQLSWEGIFNVWIIKPANLCRGRGILMESDLNTILKVSTQNSKLRHVIQKYMGKLQ